MYVGGIEEAAEQAKKMSEKVADRLRDRGSRVRGQYMAEHDTTPASGMLHCVVVTPEETAIDSRRRFMAVPLFDGELGIAPGRAPLDWPAGVWRAAARGWRAYSARSTSTAASCRSLRNEVTVLTGRAVAAEKLDAEVAAEQLRTARDRKANSEETLAIRDRLVAQARAQLRIAGHRKPSGH